MNSLLSTYPLLVHQVYYFLLIYGSTNLETLQHYFQFSPRTIRKALKHLVKGHLIIKYPNLADMRTYFNQVRSD